MKSTAIRITIWRSILFALALAGLLILPALATTGDYGINTGGKQGATTQPTAHATSEPPTSVPPTATPAGPTATPTCLDGQWGQEPNGAWVCIPNSELTAQA